MTTVVFEEPIAPPIFIVSCERAGSTLLRYMMDTHSEICSPGELSLGLIVSSLLTALSRTLEVVTADRSAIGVESSKEVISRRIIASFMNEYARRKGKKIWCDKTPFNTMHLREIHAVFPDARYVCLHRNCLDVVNSCLEVSKTGFMMELAPYAARNPQNLVTAMVDSWIDKTTRILMFEALHSAHCVRVNYESLVKSPAAVLRKIFAFVGVGHEDIVDAIFRMAHDQGGGDPKIVQTDRVVADSVGRGATIHADLIERDRLPTLNALLDQLGYPRLTNSRPKFGESSLHGTGLESAG